MEECRDVSPSIGVGDNTSESAVMEEQHTEEPDASYNSQFPIGRVSHVSDSEKGSASPIVSRMSLSHLLIETAPEISPLEMPTSPVSSSTSLEEGEIREQGRAQFELQAYLLMKKLGPDFDDMEVHKIIRQLDPSEIVNSPNLPHEKPPTLSTPPKSPRPHLSISQICVTPDQPSSSHSKGEGDDMDETPTQSVTARLRTSLSLLQSGDAINTSPEVPTLLNHSEQQQPQPEGETTQIHLMASRLRESLANWTLIRPLVQPNFKVSSDEAESQLHPPHQSGSATSPTSQHAPDEVEKRAASSSPILDDSAINLDIPHEITEIEPIFTQAVHCERVYGFERSLDPSLYAELTLSIDEDIMKEIQGGNTGAGERNPSYVIILSINVT